MHDEDRRSSFRCPVLPEDEPAILRTRNRDLMVTVHEKSAGGFGVVTDQDVSLRQGDVLSLVTNAGCSEVQVMHVERRKGRTRVGLKTLRELKHLQGKPSFSVAGLRRFLSSGSNLLRLAVMVLLCGGFFVWGATLPVGQWTKGLFADTASKKVTYAVSPRQREKQIAVNFLRLDGLTNERFVVSLNLNSEQNRQIRGIVDDTTTALSALYERRSKSTDPGQWSDAGMRTIHTSWRQIEKVLTEEQLARWDAMLEEAAPSKTSE
jgi:hypothetical protein